MTAATPRRLAVLVFPRLTFLCFIDCVLTLLF